MSVLPLHVQLLDVHLELHSNLRGEGGRPHDFSGTAQLHLEPPHPNLRRVRLHAATSLRVHQATMSTTLRCGTVVEVVRGGDAGLAADEIELRLAEPLPPNERAVLELTFQGAVQNAPAGIYTFPYTDPQGRVRWLVGTHFEPAFARMAFPCVDSPAAKTCFALTVGGVLNDVTVISNTTVQAIQVEPSAARGNEELVAWKFGPTPPLPTFCLGFWVGRFHHLKVPSSLVAHGGCLVPVTACVLDQHRDTLSPGIVCPSPTTTVEASKPLRQPAAAAAASSVGAFARAQLVTVACSCCGGNDAGRAFRTPDPPTPLEAIQSGSASRATPDDDQGCELSAAALFSMRVAGAALALFAELFAGTPFPCLKLDLVPLQVHSGLGMENFGAITFQQEFFLLGPAAPYDRFRRTARLVCHEISHQWFGNLVSPLSFDELWLKEGMARFLEFVAVNRIEPGFQIWSVFLGEVFFPAMARDLQGYPQSHPVVQAHNGDLESIQNSFDLITYGKGAALLRMLCVFVGQEVFFCGLRRYCQRHAYANATRLDLWRAIDAAVQEQARQQADDGAAHHPGASARSVAALMDPWLLQSGIPVLHASSMLDQAGTSLVLQQRAMRRAGSAAGQSGNSASSNVQQQLWPIFLAMRVSSAATGPAHTIKRVLAERETTTVPLPAASPWLVLNNQHSGFFLTIFSPEVWSWVLRAVAQERTTVEEEIGLVRDLLLIASEMQQSNSVALAADGGSGGGSTSSGAVDGALAAPSELMRQLNSLVATISRDRASWMLARTCAWQLQLRVLESRLHHTASDPALRRVTCAEVCQACAELRRSIRDTADWLASEAASYHAFLPGAFASGFRAVPAVDATHIHQEAHSESRASLPLLDAQVAALARQADEAARNATEAEGRS